MSGVPYELDLRIVELIRNDRVEIPPYPAVAMQLQELMLGGDDTYRSEDLARLIKADQALAAAVLRHVNSPARRPAAPVTSLRSAVTRLGKRQLIGLALAAGLGQEMMNKRSRLLPLKRRVWRNALFSAELCQGLAARKGLLAEEAFTCGLLHDFGKMIAIACLDEILGPHLDRSLSAARCIEVVETYHVELGTVMAERWNLPDLVSRVIMTHHMTDSARQYLRMVNLVVASDEIVAMLDAEPRVTPGDLEQVTFLSSDLDRSFVATLLPALPAMAMAFDPETANLLPLEKPSATFPTLQRPRSTLQGVCVPWMVDIKATCLTSTGLVECVATYVTPQGVGLRGARPFPVQSLVQLLLHQPEGPMEIWATVSLCEDDGPGFRIEVKPLAMDQDTGDRWLELLDSLERASSTALPEAAG